MTSLSCWRSAERGAVFIGKGCRRRCSALLILIPGVLTWQAKPQYRDIETLYRESLARNPASWMAHNNLGAMLAGMPGRLPEAIAEYRGGAADQAAIYAERTQQPRIAFCAQLPDGSRTRSRSTRQALRIAPNYAEAHNNLGNPLSRMPQAACRTPIAEYQAALRIRPDYAEAHHNLENVLARMPGRTPDAIAEYQAALRIKPDYAEAH